MSTYGKEGKVLRLNILFRESGAGTTNKFAKEIGSNQTTVRNYLEGLRLPKIDFLQMVCKRYPEFNEDWLIYGTGDKYSKQYAVTKSNIISGNSNSGDNIISSGKEGDSNITSKVCSLYEDLIESLKAQIATLTKSCADKDKQIEILEKMIKDNDSE